MIDKGKLFSICWIPLTFNAEFPTTYLEELLFWLSDFFLCIPQIFQTNKAFLIFLNGMIIYLVHL